MIFVMSATRINAFYAAGACRAKTLNVLMKRFPTPHDAEQHYSQGKAENKLFR